MLPHGHPDLDTGGIVQSRWRHTDHSITRASIGLEQSSADDVRVATEMFTPCAVAQNENRLGTRCFVAGHHQAAKGGACAEDVEEVTGDGRPIQHEWPIAVDEWGTWRGPMGDAGDVPHRPALGRYLGQVLAQQVIVGVRITAIRVELDDAVLVAHRQRTQQHRVEHREHRDGHPDPDRQNEHGRDGECGRAAKAAERNAKVVADAVHRRGSGGDPGKLPTRHARGERPPRQFVTSSHPHRELCHATHLGTPRQHRHSACTREGVSNDPTELPISTWSTSSTRRSASPTDHAWNGHPLGVCGASPSAISAMCPVPLDS